MVEFRHSLPKMEETGGPGHGRTRPDLEAGRQVQGQRQTMMRFVSAYMDDVIFSHSREEHLHHIDQMLDRPNRARLAVKLTK